MATKRCKVLAQRKFAQGAIIPPSLLNNVDTNNCLPVSPQKGNNHEPVSMFKNVSVDSFVTFLCFQDTLANHPLLKKPPKKKKRRAIVLIDKCDIPQVKPKPSTPPKPKKTEDQVKKRVRTKMEGMSLRNRTVSSTKSKLIKKIIPSKTIKKISPRRVIIKKQQIVPEKKILRKESQKPAELQPKPKNMSSSDFSSDDETPLRALRRKPVISNTRLLRSRQSISKDISPSRKLNKVLSKKILQSRLVRSKVKVMKKKKIIRKYVNQKGMIEHSTRLKLKMMLRSKANKSCDNTTDKKESIKIIKTPTDKKEIFNVARSTTDKKELIKIVKTPTDRKESVNDAKSTTDKKGSTKIVRTSTDKNDSVNVAKNTTDKKESTKIVRTSIDKKECDNVAESTTDKKESNKIVRTSTDKKESSKIVTISTDKKEIAKSTTDKKESVNSAKSTIDKKESNNIVKSVDKMKNNQKKSETQEVPLKFEVKKECTEKRNERKNIEATCIKEPPVKKIEPHDAKESPKKVDAVEKKAETEKAINQKYHLREPIKENVRSSRTKESEKPIKVEEINIKKYVTKTSDSKPNKTEEQIVKPDVSKMKLHDKSFGETDKSSFVEKWLDESSHYKADNSFTKELVNFDSAPLEPRTAKKKRPLLMSHLNSSKKFKSCLNRSNSSDAKLETPTTKTVQKPGCSNVPELTNKCNANFNVKCSCGECSSCQRITKLQENLKRSIEPLLALDMTCSGINSTSKLVNTPVETICKVDMFEPNKKVPTKSNVYEFSAENDATPPLHNIGFRQSLRQKRLSLTAEDKPSCTTDAANDAEEPLFYVDISPNVNNKAIEGRLVKNALGKFIRCKLIPKSDMKSENQIKVNSWQDLGSQKFMEEVFRTVFKRPWSSANNKEVKTEQTAHCNLSNPQPETSTSKSVPPKQTPGKPKNSKPSVTILPSNKTEFPKRTDEAKLVEAPVFRPTEQEYQDPLEYIEKITPFAAKFGVCKIIPPSSFNPECQLADDIRFTAYNQYLHRMLHRWGPSTMELCAIKKHLATQNVIFKKPPLLGGIESDLPLIYKTVLSMGGLCDVIENKNWNKVAEEMKLPKSAQLASKLDEIYMRNLLTYTTLSEKERLKFFEEVELEWLKKYKKMLSRSKDPLAEQKKLLAGESLSNSESESEYEALEEIEDCVTKGRSTTLSAFYKTATNAMHVWFSTPSSNPDVIPTPTPSEVEIEYWKYVEDRTRHICVNAASIDSGVKGYGFPHAKIKSNINRHPWNLKVLTNNSRSILRSLGRLMGVTVPTIHVGMVFTTCCWYRDPHSLPWIEYHHSGAPKIWYGIPDEQSENFRKALQKLVPSYCQNKTIWLPSDMTMVPPSMLTENGVSLCRTVQNPGEYILVFPRSFTSSICTGYVLTESVYFAPLSWLKTVYQTFQDIRNSCEPTIFSLEQLLISIATDCRATQEVLLEGYKLLKIVLELEEMHRETLKQHGIKSELISKHGKGVPLLEECYICRATLYLSKVVDLVSRGVSICLEHAVEALNSGTSLVDRSPLLVYTHTREELRDIIRKLEARLITKK